MRGRKTALVVSPTDTERQLLQQWTRSTTTPVGRVKRAQCILLAEEGVPLSHIARRVGLTQKHVRPWIARFIHERIQGLYDREGRGRKPSFSPSGRPARRQDRL